MSARAVERALEAILGRATGRRHALGQQELTLDAQQLGEAPALVGVFRSGERLVNRSHAQGDLPSDGEALGERRQKSGEILDELGFALLLDTGAEQCEPAAGLAALDEEHALERAATGMPDVESMPRRVVEQYLDEALRRGQVAGEQRDRAGGLRQRVAQREHVIHRLCSLDVLL